MLDIKPLYIAANLILGEVIWLLFELVLIYLYLYLLIKFHTPLGFWNKKVSKSKGHP